ncbi:AMP-binding protein [Sphingobium sp.]|uniref:class I adenylate-forming enzyme family protein n=1 Tax=Sphingobium sp. TaxID=1912891 RepID=UPI0028BEA485|nr:AMP-binding protein [Sphingobium sp.]
MKQNFGRITQALAIRHGDKPAIVNIERNRTFTYAQFHQLTNRVANALRMELDVGRGDTFMVILQNDNIVLLHFWTTFKQEGTLVLTNYRDSKDDHRWQVELAKPKVVFIEHAMLESHAAMLQELGCRVVVMDPPSEEEAVRYPGVIYFWDMVERAPDDECAIALEQRNHTALMRFTSGTTGRGKCAMYSIDNWLAAREGLFLNSEFDFGPDTVVLHMAAISHSSQALLIPAMSVGGTNYTMNTFDLEAVPGIIESKGITHTLMVPTVLYRLLELQRAEPRNLGSLKTILYGTSPISPTKLQELLDVFGPVFVQVYGATEAPIFATILGKEEHVCPDENSRKRLASVGRVSNGVELLIADPEGNPAPTGEVGEIWIRSRAVISGYLADAEATGKEFTDGFWRSGDLARMDEDGFVYIVDRIKDMIITGGFNVYAVEVEAALATHPAVLHSAVVGIPHEQWGEQVHADVVVRAGFSVTGEELISHVRGSLGGYKTPKGITFVDELPTSAVGKVLRRQVREKYWQGQERRI